MAERQRNRLTAEATRWFVRMTSDRVSDSDQRSFEEWLARDPAHRRAYVEIQGLWSELGDLPDPRRHMARANGSLSASSSQRRHHDRTGRRPRLQWGVALAVSLLLLVGLGWRDGWIYDRWRADHATAVGEVRSVALSDGSFVHLNTDTALAVRFSDDRRRIHLYRGEAFFTVARHSDRPFQVDAAGGTAVAVGTAFNVRMIGETVSVGVWEGQVEVSFEPGPRSPRATVTLATGLEARYGPREDIETRDVDLAAAAAWRQGRLIFADRPLRDVVAELDRYRPGVIVFLDTAVAESRFTGALSLRDTDQALAAIESALPVDIHHITRWLTVLGPRG